MRLPASGKITQGFHAGHLAVDIATGYRKPIVAPEAGVITYVGQMGKPGTTLDAGTVVQIGYQDKRLHRLCHLDSVANGIRVGVTVKEGQTVGYEGYTGYTQPDNVVQGSHLHWVMYVNNTRVDGRKYVTGVNPPTGGDTMFQSDAEIKEAYQNGLNRTPSAAEIAEWRGKSKQQFFKVMRAEVQAVHKSLAEQKAKVVSLTKQVEDLKKQVAAGGTGGQFVPVGELYIKKG